MQAMSAVGQLGYDANLEVEPRFLSAIVTSKLERDENSAR